ncbi:interleukin-13 receptor subunit alpha-1-like [Mixophyes fleayi]|uniref:interleukin-13 receptor subunit alpha-1-like n=1 Tax=Mixophyes fleayi TaxID=3061075 RepID=UPI003F4D7419
MGTGRCFHVILDLWLSVYFVLGSSGTEHKYLPPPTNITFGMDGMFCLQWQWEPPENKSNCSLKYTKNIVLQNGHKAQPRERGKCAYFEDNVENFDLNSDIIFEVQAECNSTNIMSEPVRKATQLAAGNPRTSVSNFTCVWYYLEYMNCTWQPGQDRPPNVNYSLLYWISDESYCSEVLEPTQIRDETYCSKVPQPTQFHHLLDTGKHCENYTSNNGIPVGCQFRLQKPFVDLSRVVMVVTDRSKNVKPFISYIHLNNIAKLRPPTINNVYRTPNQSIHLSWNASEVHKESLYQVRLEISNGESKQDFMDILGTIKEIPNVLPDITYTVKVRVRLPYGATTNNYLWSEWSEEKTLPGKDEGRTTSIILLFLIPVIIVVAAVILLIYMRRLQILIFPRIPDPGKVLSNDLQQWIKNGRSVYNEPKKEEICQVSLLETPLSSPCEE